MQYLRLGSPTDLATKAQPGYALMGGGTDLDDAFLWVCVHANGGDFLVLRAAGTDAYNAYIESLCKLNSVSTLVIPSRAAANDPSVSDKIAQAEAIFLAGGDQANYIRFWSGTPVQKEINRAIERGVPIGGTSAGLAVLGEWAYSAEGDKLDDPNLDSKLALANPKGPRLTLVHNFLNIPVMKGIVTDTHFAERDRMGRLLAYLAAVNTGKSTSQVIRGLGIDQETAVLLNRDGSATVMGKGNAYVVEPPMRWEVPAPGKPFSGGPFLVKKIHAGEKFNLHHSGEFGGYYQLTVKNGTTHSDRIDRGIY